MTAPSGLMMACACCEIAAYANVLIMNFQNHLKNNHIEVFHLIRQYVKGEIPRILLTAHWTPRPSEAGLQLTTHGQMMMRLTMVISFFPNLMLIFFSFRLCAFHAYFLCIKFHKISMFASPSLIEWMWNINDSITGLHLL